MAGRFNEMKNGLSFLPLKQNGNYSTLRANVPRAAYATTMAPSAMDMVLGWLP